MKSRLAILIIAISLWHCASQTNPTGGPRDETPPKLLRSTPSANQKNFKGKAIELTFDESIQLFNPKEEILISPSIGKEVIFKARQNRVTIEPETQWQDSTTYSILFREGIQDLHEGNPTDNLRLAFSTGPFIDSLYIAGRINEVLTETIPTNITIAIYASDTFDIFNDSPTYLTKSGTDGKFKLQNLKPGNYHIYAFDDKNKNLKVESKTERFGYKSLPLDLKKSKDSVQITLFNLDAREFNLQSIRRTQLNTKLRFNKSLVEYQLSSDQHLIHSYGDDPVEISIYNPSTIKDSLAVRVRATDSLTQEVDTVVYVKPVDAKSIKAEFKSSISSFDYDFTDRKLSAKIDYTLPLASLNMDSIGILIDSTHSIHFNPDQLKIDSLRKTIKLTHQIHPDSLFRDKEKPISLMLGKAFIISVENDSSKAAAQKISYVKEESTGTLLVKVETDYKSFEVQLLNGQNKVVRSMRDLKNFAFRFLPAQNYKLRVLIDENENGTWDTGNPLFWREPEPIYYYISPDKKYDFPIRANWELGPYLLKF